MEASAAPFVVYLVRLALVTTVPDEPSFSAETSDPFLCTDVTSS